MINNIQSVHKFKNSSHFSYFHNFVIGTSKKFFFSSVENITYLCTKVNIENETAVSSGCYKQMKNGHEMELCVCETTAGESPCNDAYINSYLKFNLLIFIILMATFFINPLKYVWCIMHAVNIKVFMTLLFRTVN